MKFKGKSTEPERTKENVWSPKENKIIAVIEDGFFETTDEDLIQQLTELGYEQFADIPIKVAEEKNDTPLARKRILVEEPEMIKVETKVKKVKK
jgi:hypothetical protein